MDNYYRSRLTKSLVALSRGSAAADTQHFHTVLRQYLGLYLIISLFDHRHIVSLIFLSWCKISDSSKNNNQSMIYRLIILLIAAGCVMCTSYSCEAIEGLTLDEIW